MNLNQLKYFQAICTYQTASAAAEYLHISQPSLSNAIKELEQEFGVTLFHRRHRGMELTAEGEVLLKLAKDLLNRAEHMEQVMHDLGSERKKLRLGVPPMIGSLLLPYIYREFLAENPEIQLDITECGRHELLDRLSDDFLDMVFLPHNRVLGQEYSMLQAASLEIVCCASKESKLADMKTISASDLADAPLVLFKDSFYQTEEIKKWFALSGIKPNIILQTEQLSTVQSIISHNAASGFLFRQLIEASTDLMPIPTETPIFVNVSLVWKSDAYFFNSMKKLRKYILEKNPFAKF